MTVAVTGPTGDIGRPFVGALEREPRLGRVVGMARSAVDPTEDGWTKTEYVRGDILDRAPVHRLVEGVDVVVHLAFVIMGSDADTRRINVDGSRSVFEAAVASHEDVMAAALVAAMLGNGPPGVYNVAGPGRLTLTDLANAFGWKSVKVPAAAARFTAAAVTRLPFLPPKLDWVNALRGMTLMDTAKAQRELGWKPTHDAHETLSQLVESARERGLLR